MTTVLRYTGNDEGVPFVMGVPARDLTESDLDALVGRFGADAKAVHKNLTAHGLYVAVKSKADKPSTEAASESAGKPNKE